MDRIEHRQRVAWVDYCKVVGVFLVLFGHYTINPFCKTVIYSFHVPLFFALSGYVFSFNKAVYPDFRSFFARKVRSLIFPYLFFALFSFVLWFTFFRSASDPPGFVVKALFRVFYGFPFESALWFIPCLFLVELMFWPLRRIKSRGILITIMAAAAVIGNVKAHFWSRSFPWSVDVAFVAIGFYGIFAAFNREVSMVIDGVAKRPLWLAILISVAVTAALLNGRIETRTMSFNNYFLFYVSSFGLITGTAALCRMSKCNNVISSLGRNTIVIIGLSGAALMVIQGLFVLVVHHALSLQNVSLARAFALTVLQILVMFPAIIFLNCYLPGVLGRAARSKI
jgi:acyltransferase